MKIHSILAIMDKPKHAQTAMKRALALHAASGAPVELISFCWQALADDDLLDRDARRDIRRQLLDERKRWQKELLTEAGAPPGVRGRTVWTDDIADWVEKRIDESSHDLILKSEHYSKTLAHTPLDWRLLREVSVPVLLAAARRRKPTGNVLAAIDLRRDNRMHRKLNQRVLDAAHTFGELQNAKVHCVYVIEISEVLSDLDAIDPKIVRRKAIERSRERLDALLAPYDIPKSRIHMPVGKVGRTVAGIAHKTRADLLVVGTAAHRGRQLVGLGNSAERVLAKAPCDVLAVHP